MRPGWRLWVEWRIVTKYILYFRASGSRIGCMQAIETALDVPRVKAARIRFWFRRKKGFPRVFFQLAAISEHGASVHVEGSTDTGATLAYSNHRSVAPYSDIVLAKIFDDVRFGRSIIFRAAKTKRTPSPICGCRRWPWWCLRPKLGLSTIQRFRRLSMHVASTLTLISRRPPP